MAAKIGALVVLHHLAARRPTRGLREDQLQRGLVARADPAGAAAGRWSSASSRSRSRRVDGGRRTDVRTPRPTPSPVHRPRPGEGPRRHAEARPSPLDHPAVPGGASPTFRRARAGVIALKEANCTVCYKCSRECPDWCIYIDAHKETHEPGLRRQGAVGQGPRPVRDRLRALHVLRDLRRGLPVRRAVLEPGVRVRRVRHRRAHAREGEARGVDLHGPAAAVRSRTGAEVPAEAESVAPRLGRAGAAATPCLPASAGPAPAAAAPAAAAPVAAPRRRPRAAPAEAPPAAAGCPVAAGSGGARRRGAGSGDVRSGAGRAAREGDGPTGGRGAGAACGDDRGADEGRGRLVTGAEEYAFVVIGRWSAVVGAFRVVTARNVVRAALYLVVTLSMVAGVYLAAGRRVRRRGCRSSSTSARS